MKTLKNIIIIIVIVAVLIIAKIIFFPAGTDTKGAGGKGGPGGKSQGPVPVEVYITKATPLDNRVFISGTVVANEEVKLVPESAGKVTGIYFKEGAMVTKGQLLVKLNDAELRAQLKKLEVQEKLLASQEQRLNKLVELKGVSQEEYESTLSQLNTIRADMEVNRAQVEKMEIRAPFSGRIGIKNISEGSYVSPSTFIAVLDQSNPVKIDFAVPEKYAGLVQLGDTLSFTIDGRNGKIVSKVAAMDPMIDQTTRTLRVRAIADNKDNSILPGAFARINFLLGHSNNAITVPTEAVVPVLKGKKVFVIRKGKATEVMVETGLRTDRNIEITSGLQEGDTVVTKGLMQIKPGSQVRILNAGNTNKQKGHTK